MPVWPVVSSLRAQLFVLPTSAALKLTNTAQGHTNPNVLRKKAMLEAEGVELEGCRLKDGSVVMLAHDLC